MSNISQLAARIRDMLDESLKQAKQISDIEGAIRFIGEVISEIEVLAPEIGDLTGNEKKKVAVVLVNEFVNIPFVPEWLEAKIFDYVIEAIVKTLNNYLGHAWAAISNKDEATKDDVEN